MFQLRVELCRGIRQSQGLQAHRTAVDVLACQDKVAAVGDHDLPVTLPVAGHLVTLGGQPSVVFDGL